ncbi:MAG: RNase III inhibitor, partial [Lachnospiraceae bacterium]|nr:RNase III inhibitor [Lachnospiraceae bacterium]
RPHFYGNAKMPVGKLSEDETFEAPFEETAMQAAKPQASYSAVKAAARPEPKAKKKSLKDIVQHVGENFQECLLRLIDERGLTDTVVYKKANLDRKLFSKIRCTRNYTPSKRTAVALAIALTLNLDQTIDLLGRAGIALSPGSKFDLIIEYCIENGIYDIYEINALLFEYGEQLLGC